MRRAPRSMLSMSPLGTEGMALRRQSWRQSIASQRSLSSVEDTCGWKQRHMSCTVQIAM